MTPENGERLKDLASLRIDHDALEERPAPRRHLRWILTAAVLIALALLAPWAWRRWVEPLRVPRVRVARVLLQAPGESSALLTATGYVVAQRQAAVTSKITGRLVYLPVREGSRVRRGEVIGRLENRDLEAGLEESRRALEVARASWREAQAREVEAGKEFERQERLLRERVSSQADYDAAEARYKVARARVESTAAEIPRAEAAVTVAQVFLENTRIVAPFDGVVTTKNSEVGEIVAPVSAGGPASGNSVVLIADMESLEAEVDINETNIGRLREGQPAEIVLDAFPDRRYRGRLRQIVPTANRQKATIEGKVEFLERGEEVLPEMGVRVTFLEEAEGEVDPRPRVFVPRAALVTREGARSVLMLRDEHLQVVPVRTGPELEGRVEILEGLRGGERVVLDPPDGLGTGSRVRIETGD